MQLVRRSSRHYTRLWFCLAALTCCAFNVNGQTHPRPDLDAFVLKAYNAYLEKDQQLLFSLHSQTSPYFAEFKSVMLSDFAHRQNVRFAGKLVRGIKADVQSDKATLRVVVNLDARDIDTGREAEGFPEWDHTLYLVKEQGTWKLWRFVVTAEEFTGDYLAAETDSERANLIAKAKPVTYGFLKGLEEIGRGLLEERGDDVHAAEILQLDYRLSVETKNMFGEAGALIALGDVYFAQGDYVRAGDNYQRILSLAEKVQHKVAIAAVSAKMGNLHYAQGNFAQAMDHYLKSIRLYEEAGSKIEITYPLANLGNAYFSLGKYEQALEHYQKVLKIYDQLDSKAGAAWLRNQIGEVYAAQGNNEIALRYYDLSLKAHEELENKPMQAYSLNGIGRIRFAEGKYAEAIVLLTRAAVLARANRAPEILWKALNLLGQSHRALHDNDNARQAFGESIATIEQLRTQVTGNERDQQLSFESKTTPYVAMVELLVEKDDLAGAFVYAERAKGRMLLDVLRHGRAEISGNMTADERAKQKHLNASMTVVSAQIRQEIALPKPDQAKLRYLEARLQRARLAYEAYETRIHAAHPELRVERGDAQTLSLGEAESLIPDDRTALIEYVVAPDKTYLFVLTRASEGPVALKVFSIPITPRELGDRVTQFRQLLAGNSLGFKDPAHQLYELLLRPAAKELAGKNVVGIVPSGQLWELPFQALLSSRDTYLLQDHALFYAPSLSVLREMRKQSSERSAGIAESPAGQLRGGAMLPAVGRVPESVIASMVKVRATPIAPVPALLAMGNPSLTSSLLAREKSTDRSLSLGDLPAAEREVKDLGEIYGIRRSKILIGSAAREETVKAEAGRYPILHFATHGLLDDENPLYSRLLLTSSNGSDDGFLEAREIMKLDLHADLAVLSACQTARGTFSPGEGLIGMSWAFFIAGTSTTVVSQWKVDSASTARLMVSFHRAWQGFDKPAPVNKAEALRRAALKLMSDPKYRHPFYWSGFVVVGNGM
jgi:CHAT domain-containing protein/Flp pilus assembly protein TadD